MHSCTMLCISKALKSFFYTSCCIIVMKIFNQLQKRKEELLQEQVDIDRNEDKDVQLESRHYRQDPDCRAAGWLALSAILI